MLVIGRTAIAFLRNYIVPAAKCVGADLLEFAVPEVVDVVSGKKKFKTAAKGVGRQTKFEPKQSVTQRFFY